MAIRDRNLALKVAGLSAIAGMRSMSGPALLALDNRALARTKIGHKIFGSPEMKIAVQAMAVGELIFDKLPMAPKRTDPLPMLARAASGALIGASLYAAAQESPLKGALVGSSSALAAAMLSFQARKFLTKNLHVPDTVVALAEDVLVLSRGLQMLHAALDDSADADLMRVTQPATLE
jgi:uncharacterized membrane protein